MSVLVYAASPTSADAVMLKNKDHLLFIVRGMLMCIFCWFIFYLADAQASKQCVSCMLYNNCLE